MFHNKFLWISVFVTSIMSQSPVLAQPKWETNKWYTIEIAMIGKRLVVFGSANERQFVKIHDMTLPESVPSEGHICFQHEEKGNASGTRFDSIVLRELAPNFDINSYASKTRRIGSSAIGKTVFSQSFVNKKLGGLVPISGEWRVKKGYLECNNFIDSWAQIRTKDKFRDFLLRFKLYRRKNNSMNWAGVALRVGANGGDGANSIRVVAFSKAGKNQLAVFPMYTEQKRRERERWLAEAMTRWRKVIGPSLVVIGKINENQTLDNIRWKVVSARNLGTVLKSTNSLIKPKTTPGKFVFVEFEIENMSKNPQTFLERPLYDAKGRKYESISDALFYFDKKTVFILERVNPNIPHRFVHVYETAKDASGFSIGISNLRLIGKKTGVIELGF